MNTPPKPPLSYQDAGVSIDRGNALVERIKPLAARTGRAGVMGGLGGFGALFDLGRTGFRDPVLVSGTDGVGTKLKLAIATGRHDTIGVDLVAMCVNDLLVQGAEPLFFLDYFATGRLDVDVAAAVVEGISRGCELAGCALVGGETAEMPDMYAPGDYDLAGFSVGAVERDRIIDGSRVRPGDAVIGIASSGAHSNGYSLIRRIVERAGTGLDSEFHGRPLGEVLLEPTRVYVKPVLELISRVDVHALAHITGGGLPENLPRVMPNATRAVIDAGSWARPALFDWLQTQGNIAPDEMYRTFNCGVGMVAVVAAEAVSTSLDCLAAAGETAWVIGRIESATGNLPRVRMVQA